MVTANVDPAYVAYLTRENAWLRAQLERVTRTAEELAELLEELRIEAVCLEARGDTLAAREVDET